MTRSRPARPSAAKPAPSAPSAPSALAGVTGRSVRLPHGVRDYLPEAAARRRGIAEAVLAEVDRWGYRRIITPAFEYETVLGRGLGPSAQAQSVRFVEPGTGEVVLLRPDLTPQISRMVATRFPDDEGPLRLAYEGAVIRLAQGGQRELFQAGVELVRAPAPAGDVEVIALAASALTAAGVPHNFVLDLGEAQVARAALGGLDEIAGGGPGSALREAIARKDIDEAGRLARALDLPPWRQRLLEELPSLYGGPEVIDRAAKLLAAAGRSHAPARLALDGLRDLQTVIARLAAWSLGSRLSVDLGEVRGFDYYTGVRFSGYAPGVGDALLSGGRYDHLVERYGAPATAAGFAVDVERVALALPEEQPLPASGVYLAGEPLSRHRVAQALRAQGVRVVEDMDDGDGKPASSTILAERARRAGAARVMMADRETLDATGSARYPASPPPPPLTRQKPESARHEPGVTTSRRGKKKAWPA